jgi:hypothetical protein
MLGAIGKLGNAAAVARENSAVTAPAPHDSAEDRQHAVMFWLVGLVGSTK